MKKINSYDELIIILSVKSCVILSMTRTCSICNIIKEKLKAIEFLYPNIEFFEIYLEDLPIFRGQYLIFAFLQFLFFKMRKKYSENLGL